MCAKAFSHVIKMNHIKYEDYLGILNSKNKEEIYNKAKELSDSLVRDQHSEFDFCKAFAMNRYGTIPKELTRKERIKYLGFESLQELFSSNNDICQISEPCYKNAQGAVKLAMGVDNQYRNNLLSLGRSSWDLIRHEIKSYNAKDKTIILSSIAISPCIPSGEELKKLINETVSVKKIQPKETRISSDSLSNSDKRFLERLKEVLAHNDLTLHSKVMELFDERISTTSDVPQVANQALLENLSQNPITPYDVSRLNNLISDGKRDELRSNVSKLILSRIPQNLKKENNGSVVKLTWAIAKREITPDMLIGIDSLYGLKQKFPSYFGN